MQRTITYTHNPIYNTVTKNWKDRKPRHIIQLLWHLSHKTNHVAAAFCCFFGCYCCCSSWCIFCISVYYYDVHSSNCLEINSVAFIFLIRCMRATNVTNKREKRKKTHSRNILWMQNTCSIQWFNDIVYSLWFCLCVCCICLYWFLVSFSFLLFFCVFLCVFHVWFWDLAELHTIWWFQSLMLSHLLLTPIEIYEYVCAGEE